MGSPCSAQLLRGGKNREGGNAAALQRREKAELESAPNAGGFWKIKHLSSFSAWFHTCHPGSSRQRPLAACHILLQGGGSGSHSPTCNQDLKNSVISRTRGSGFVQCQIPETQQKLFQERFNKVELYFSIRSAQAFLR